MFHPFALALEEKYFQALVATDSVFDPPSDVAVNIYRVELSGTSFLCRSLVYSEGQIKALYKLCPPLFRITGSYKASNGIF